MFVHSARRVLPAISLCLLISACSTTPKPMDDPAGDFLALDATEFRPASSLSLLHLDVGRYPNLYSSGSYALWVDASVAQAKLQKDATDGISVLSSLANDAEYILENYIVFECHLESVFPDASIAYDVVGLRNIEVYLVKPDGTQVRPIQRILGSHADESQLGALKRFGRTNVFVFAKEDILAGTPAIQRDAEAVRMIVDGFNSNFYFQWNRAAPEQPPAPETEATGSLGFSALYSKLQVLARKF